MSSYLPRERWLFLSIRRDPDRFVGNAMLLSAFAITIVESVIGFRVVVPAGGYEWLASHNVNGPFLGLIWSGMHLRNLDSRDLDKGQIGRERMIAAAWLVAFSVMPFVLDRAFDRSEAEFGSIMYLVTPMIVLGLLFFTVARASRNPSTYSSDPE
jgi:hypothetical protein